MTHVQSSDEAMTNNAYDCIRLIYERPANSKHEQNQTDESRSTDPNDFGKSIEELTTWKTDKSSSQQRAD